jgi:hypothetical protein
MKKLFTLLFLLLFSVNAQAANMAYFDGSHYLSWTDSSEFDIGANTDYKFKANLKMFPKSLGVAWLGGILNLGTIGHNDSTNLGQAGWAMGNAGWVESTKRIDDTAIYAVEIERASGVLTIKVDTVTVLTENSNTITNGTYPDTWRSVWQLGGYKDG